MLFIVKGSDGVYKATTDPDEARQWLNDGWYVHTYEVNGSSLEQKFYHHETEEHLTEKAPA